MASIPKAVASGKIFFFLVAAAFSALGQGQEDPIFKSGVNLVLMDVSVTNSHGVPVAELAQTQFEVKEKGQTREIARFEPGSTNVSVVLVADASRSMTPRREALLRGVTALLSQFDLGDEGALVAFNENIDILSEFVSFRQPSNWLQRLLARTPTGQTALYDAVITANRLLSSSAYERRVIIILSDGADTASKETLEATLNDIRSSNALIYAVGLFKAGDPDTNSGALKSLAEVTGGTASFDPDGANLPDVFRAIMKDLRSRYVLGFYAQSPAGDRLEIRRLAVTARDAQGKKLEVRARREYRIGTVEH